MSITPHGLSESDVGKVVTSSNAWNTHGGWLKEMSDTVHGVKRNKLSEQSFNGRLAEEVRAEIKAIATEFEEAQAQSLELAKLIDEHSPALNEAHQEMEDLRQKQLPEIGLGLDEDGDVILVADLDENGHLPGGTLPEAALEAVHEVLDPIMKKAQSANDSLEAGIRSAIGDPSDWH